MCQQLGTAKQGVDPKQLMLLLTPEPGLPSCTSMLLGTYLEEHIGHPHKNPSPNPIPYNFQFSFNT